MATTAAAIDARPIAADLFLYAGDDVHLKVTVTDDAGAAVDLTGYTAKASIRSTIDAPLAVDFVAVVTANVIDLTLPTALTTDLPVKGVWDVQVTNATGAVTTLAAGKVTVQAEVTK